MTHLAQDKFEHGVAVERERSMEELIQNVVSIAQSANLSADDVIPMLKLADNDRSKIESEIRKRLANGS